MWYRLRAPFALTPDMTAHECQWESFDCDAAGCLLCGHVHRCADGKCKRVCAVEDGVVCTITAFYVRTINFQQNEYEDRVISCVSRKNLYSGDTVLHTSEIVSYFCRELLLSSNARQAHHVEQQRFCAKIGQAVLKHLLKSETKCFITSLQQCIENEHSNHAMLAYDAAQRQACIPTLVYFITHLISQCRQRLHVKFKNSEMRMLTFGLLYMMRHGIHAHGVTILPRLRILHELLPTEPVLQRVHNFRAKHITDVENKFKLILRSMSCHDVVALGLHENA